MPCSRTPKWKFRPANDDGATAVEALMEVLVEGSRSALPPHREGTSSAAFCRTFPEDARVASGFGGAVPAGGVTASSSRAKMS